MGHNDTPSKAYDGRAPGYFNQLVTRLQLQHAIVVRNQFASWCLSGVLIGKIVHPGRSSHYHTVPLTGSKIWTYGVIDDQHSQHLNGAGALPRIASATA